MPKSARTDEIESYLISEDGIYELTMLAKSGKTLQQIADHFTIHRNTLYLWSKKHEEIQTALVEGNKVADERVEHSLYEQCFGHMEKVVTLEQDDKGNVIKKTIRTQYVPPNVTAIQYWLSNRSKGVWKARQQLEMGASEELGPLVIINDLGASPKIPTLEEEEEPIPELNLE